MSKMKTKEEESGKVRPIQFCSHCGARLRDGVKFCENCGESVPVKAAEPVEKDTGTEGKNERSYIYDGVVHKCPNCGEVLGAFAIRCPSCGYEIRNTSVSNAVQDFSLQIQNASSEDEAANLIQNFPVPNTKEDILEFIILASANISIGSFSKVTRAWQMKFEQSFQKAKLVFNDEEFSKIQKIYDDTTKNIKKQNLIQGFKNTGRAINKSGGTFLKILEFIIKNILTFSSVIVLLCGLMTDRTGKSSVEYQMIGSVLLLGSCGTLFKKKTSFIEVGLTIAAAGFTLYISKFFRNGEELLLFGGIALVMIFVWFVKKPSSK